LEFISEIFEDHLGGWAVAYNLEFVLKYCCACSKAVRAHSVFVIRPGMLECIVKLGRYNVNSILCPDPQEFLLVRVRLMSEIWGWFIHAALLFVVKMPMYVCSYVCSHSSWWIIKCKLEVLSPLIRVSRLKVFLV